MEIMASSEGGRWGCDGWSTADILFSTQEKEQRGEDEIHGDDHENRGDDGRGGGAADLLGAAAGVQAFLATHGGDGSAEHDALDEAGGDIAKEERVERSVNVAAKSEIRLGDAKERTAEHTHEVGPDGQARKHDDHGEKLGRDEKLHRIDGHGLEGVDFLADFHGAKFRGESGAGAADNDDGGDERS